MLKRNLLVYAASLNLAIALLHIVIVVGGPEWYRFFGAGETMAQLAEAGSWQPAVFTLLISLVFFIWAIYTLSGAGIIRRLPFLRLALVAITIIYLLRGLAGLTGVVTILLLSNTSQGCAFLFWTSIICLLIGMVHIKGTYDCWPELLPKPH